MEKEHTWIKIRAQLPCFSPRCAVANSSEQYHISMPLAPMVSNRLGTTTHSDGLYRCAFHHRPGRTATRAPACRGWRSCNAVDSNH
jgi:hypothetical protein